MQDFSRWLAGWGFFLLCLCPSSVLGLGRLGDEFVLGSGNFRSHRLQWSVVFSTSWVSGGDFFAYDSQKKEGPVWALHPFVNRLWEEQNFEVFGLFYPRVQGAQSSGLRLSWERALEDSEQGLRLSTSLGWAYSFLKGVRGSGPPARRRLHEGAVAFGMHKTFAEEFIFELSGGFFLFDQRVRAWSRWESSLDQRDLAPLGGLAPVLSLPFFVPTQNHCQFLF